MNQKFLICVNRVHKNLLKGQTKDAGIRNEIHLGLVTKISQVHHL